MCIQHATPNNPNDTPRSPAGPTSMRTEILRICTAEFWKPKLSLKCCEGFAKHQMHQSMWFRLNPKTRIDRRAIPWNHPVLAEKSHPREKLTFQHFRWPRRGNLITLQLNKWHWHCPGQRCWQRYWFPTPADIEAFGQYLSQQIGNTSISSTSQLGAFFSLKQLELSWIVSVVFPSKPVLCLGGSPAVSSWNIQGLQVPILKGKQSITNRSVSRISIGSCHYKKPRQSFLKVWKCSLIRAIRSSKHVFNHFFKLWGLQPAGKGLFVCRSTCPSIYRSVIMHEDLNVSVCLSVCPFVCFFACSLFAFMVRSLVASLCLCFLLCMMVVRFMFLCDMCLSMCLCLCRSFLSVGLCFHLFVCVCASVCLLACLLAVFLSLSLSVWASSICLFAILFWCWICVSSLHA